MKFSIRVLTVVMALMLLTLSFPALAWTPEDNSIKAKYVVLVEASSGNVLYGKNAEDRAFPASTTKIMTCMLALENGNLDDKVTVGPEVNRYSEKSSLMGLKENETVTLRDLIYGMMLVSGNDAAAAIAMHIGGSMEGFADMMNKKAASLGMKDTHFVTPNGVHKDDHYSTAHDMARLTIYAMQNEDFRTIVKKRVYTVPPTNKNKTGYTLENTNLLVNTTTKAKDKNLNYEYSYAIGVKTGDTPNALRCLVAAAEKDGVMLISVQLYDQDQYTRFAAAKDMFEWGYKNFTSIRASELSLPKTIDVQVSNCSFDEQNTLALNVDIADKSIACSTQELDAIKANLSAITMSVVPLKEISAPVQAGDHLATVAYKYEGTTLFIADAYASRSVQGMVSTVAGAQNSAPLPTLAPISGKAGSGPWLFIALVLGFAVLVTGVVMVLRNKKRNKRRRSIRSKRGTYAYRGRW